jgi:hypothetical protein
MRRQPEVVAARVLVPLLGFQVVVLELAVSVSHVATSLVMRARAVLYGPPTGGLLP